MFSMFFTGDHVHQSAFLKKANKIDSISPREGLCEIFSNDYIQTNNHDEFFKKIQKVSGCKLDSNADLGNLKLTINELTKDENKYFLKDKVFLNDRVCFDAFSFVSNKNEILKNNINKIIEKLKNYNRHIYVHVAIGDFHSFVIEQRFKKNKFVYYVYDPNNRYKPKALFTIEDIACAINQILFLIKSTYFRSYLLNGDNNILLSFCVYPADTKERKDPLLERLEKKLIAIPSKFACDCLVEAKSLIRRYKQKQSARGILLSNLLILFDQIESITKIDFSNEKKLVINALKQHLLSADFMMHNQNDLLVCFSYLKTYGKMTLLQEVARLGDMHAVQLLLPKIKPSVKNNQNLTPLHYAMMEGQVSIVEQMLNHIDANDEFFSQIENAAFYYMNCFQSFYLSSSSDSAPSEIAHSLRKILGIVATMRSQRQKQSSNVAPDSTTSAILNRKNDTWCELFKKSVPILVLGSAVTAYTYVSLNMNKY